MIKINEKSKCCGCYGCFNVCPEKCISMIEDKEGFVYPRVNEDVCINCKQCENVCPVINDTINQNQINVYACKNKDIDKRNTSSSGGIFTLLCDYVIKNDGVVFGAMFDKNLDVIHSYAKDIKECEKFKGSKYVQSEINDMYSVAKKFLEEGKMVLFSGTQCQIKGLNLFLGKKYQNLISVEIICHGVPSPLVMKLYKKYLTKKYNSKVKSINFRDKKTGWKKYSCEIKFENGEIISKLFLHDVYMKGFLKNLYLRPSCHECRAKNFSSNSDISLADYWGIETKYPEIDDDKGVSLVCINTQKGKNIFKSISNDIEIMESDLNHAIIYNPCIVKSVESNKNREQFFKNLNNEIENIIDYIEYYLI